MSYLLLSLQVTLAAILTMAALSKIAYPQQILAALRQSSIPSRLASSVAALVILLELESALALLFSATWSLPFAFLSAFVLLGIFTSWILWILRQNLQVSCGCFGPSHAHINKRYLVRNSCFMSLALGGFFLSFFTRSVLPDPSVWTLIIAVLCIPTTASLLRFRLLRTDKQLSIAV